MLRQGYQRDSVAAASKYTYYIIWLVIDFEQQVNRKSFRIFSHYSLLRVNLVRFFIYYVYADYSYHTAHYLSEETQTLSDLFRRTRPRPGTCGVASNNCRTILASDTISAVLEFRNMVFYTLQLVANMLRFTVQPFICFVRMDTQKRVSAAL